MNIIQFDETIDIETLHTICKAIHEKYPDLEFIAVPKGIDFMMDVNAEQLLDILDKLSVALAKIKEERPEEYHRAYKERVWQYRDKQWKDAINKANKNNKPININKVNFLYALQNYTIFNFFQSYKYNYNLQTFVCKYIKNTPYRIWQSV